MEIKTCTVYAPIRGEAIELCQVEDPVFSAGIVGQGVAIRPAEGRIFAPFDGEVFILCDVANAIGLASREGVELLIHVGLDTASLNGAFSKAYVKDGDRVRKGDLLMEFDLAAVREKGFHIETPVVVTNADDYTKICCRTGTVNVGDVLLEVSFEPEKQRTLEK